MVTTPSSTYRLQITKDFPLQQAAQLVDYLHDLGVGAIYLSPILQSTIGSTHGYDTTDPTTVDADRGGQAGLDAVFAAAQDAGLGVVIDIVPNHVGIAEPTENPAWWDVLRLGRESAYADWFDIDWSQDKILLPVLGDDAVLEVAGDELRYYEHRFPTAPGTVHPGDDAETVHARQHYELAHWSRGDRELTHRRFFAVATLAGVRMEDPAVFEATHALIPRWTAAGVAGLRIDHPDGLVDPGAYLRQLDAWAPDAWITVEKILEPGEDLPADWPVAGTTGYDAMREVNGIFVDGAAESAFTALYQRLTGDEQTIADHIVTGKHLVVDELLVAERRRMARLVPEIPDAAEAIGEIATAFEVYRSYLPDGAEHLDHALALAAERRPDLADTLTALSPRLHDGDDELARRLQQLSGATMAKGVEDTAFYRYSRFVALNEVGSDPSRFGIPVAEFHDLQQARANDWPETMTSLSTHDTKRGEDIRARLAVLAEIPEQWTAFAELFLSRTAIPNRRLAYFLAQTVIGTGPIERDRLHAYAEKSAREASEDTRWTAPVEEFEATLAAAIDLAYDDTELRAAWDALDAVVQRPGWSNALGQKLVQLTLPGVPDVYQGTELWDDALVDPDNRRPVDFAERRSMLAGLDAAPALDETGAAKLWVVRQALRTRRDRPELFAGYRPVTATGPAADHLIGFDRGGALTLATRLPVALTAAGGWGSTTIELPEPRRDLISGRRHSGIVEVADVLGDLGVALLVRD